MRIALFGILFLLGSVLAHAESVTIKTATGEVSVNTKPEKIAVFEVSAIDTLSALGVDIQATPDRVFVSYLDGVLDRAQHVGTLFEPNLETLAVMDPSLIILGARSSTKAEAVSAIAPTIDMTISGKDIIAEGKAQIEAFGKLFAIEDRANELLEQIDEKLAQAKQAVKGKGNALIVLTNGPKISAFGIGSRFGWLHENLGLPAAVKELEVNSHGQIISFEFIAQSNPDWILVVDRGAAIGAKGGAGKSTLDNPLVASTNAAKNDQIIYLEPAPLYVAGGGATSIMMTLDEIITAFKK